MRISIKVLLAAFLLGMPCASFASVPTGTTIPARSCGAPAQQADTSSLPGQSQEQLIKERKKAAKLAEKTINAKVLKDARKQAKELKKEGWKAAPGSLPLEKQLSNLLLMQYEMSGNFPKYIIGKSAATGGSYGVARRQASTRARLEIATNMNAEIAALTENTDANTELSKGEAETVAKMVDASKQLVQQSIGKTDVVFEAYREVAGNTEVQIGLAYDGKLARATLLKLFEKDNAEIRRKLDELTK